MDSGVLAELRQALETAIAHAESLHRTKPEERALERMLAHLLSARDELLLLPPTRSQGAPEPHAVAGALEQVGNR
jgi:hypothetical protein